MACERRTSRRETAKTPRRQGERAGARRPYRRESAKTPRRQGEGGVACGVFREGGRSLGEGGLHRVTPLRREDAEGSVRITRLMPSLISGTLKLMSKPSVNRLNFRYVSTWAL